MAKPVLVRFGRAPAIEAELNGLAERPEKLSDQGFAQILRSAFSGGYGGIIFELVDAKFEDFERGSPPQAVQ